jgi:hypothetical protein
MTLQSRTQALLDLVEADRARRCAEILDEARARAARTVAAAHEEARERMRAAFDEERHRLSSALAAAEARLATHRRLREQRLAAAFLKAGLQSLPEALRARWQRPAARAQWISRAIGEARSALASGDWNIAHAPPLTDEERAALTAALAQISVVPQFVADEALRAGLAISAGGNVVDGTLAGIVADRADVGARLLKHLEPA